MTTWSDESLPSTTWGDNFLLINATDLLLIGDTAGEYIVLEDDSTPL
jgi:hypothetical protein